jgi:D-amino-acid oxidase
MFIVGNIVTCSVSVLRKRVLIIGAGVNGLTCAHALQERGCDITLVAEDIGTHTTSAVAGALWEIPPAVCGYPQFMPLEHITRDQRFSLISYRRFMKLANIRTTGVRVNTVNFYYEHVIEKNQIEKLKTDIAKASLANYRSGFSIISANGIDPSIYKDAYSYDTPVIDTDTYLNWLFGVVSSHPKTKIVIKRVSGHISDLADDLLREYNADIIINCTGLGSSQLADDPSVYGVRGGLVYVDNSSTSLEKITQAHCTSLARTDKDIGYFIFILPRAENLLVLGGVAEVGMNSVDVSPESYPPYAEILQRCQKFLPALSSCRVIKQKPLRVGIRPFRKYGLRLERDYNKKVIHNYGHGGAGVLLSWGCAEEVCKLAAMSQ